MMVGVDVAGVGEAGGEAMANGDGGAVCPWSVLGTVWKKFWREEVEFGGKETMWGYYYLAGPFNMVPLTATQHHHRSMGNKLNDRREAAA